jgi:hypothetical protein
VVARAKLRQAATVPSPKLSSPIAPDRHVLLVPPPTTGVVPTPAGSHILGRADCRSPEEAQAEIDRVFAQLADLDRRRFPFGC